jgi:hypothetical protein
MRRFVLLTYMGLTLCCLAGCHLCHKKRFAPVYYSECQPCGCGSSIAAPPYSIPQPASVVIPLTPGGIPGPPGVGIPGPPAR